MKTVKVNLGERSYKIHISAGVLERLDGMLREYSDVTKVIIITDKNVERFYGEIVTKGLHSYKPEVTIISIDPGEKQKSLSTAEYLYDRLFEHEVDRRSLIIALGGGVVGDLAGYVAATYMRGITYVQVPTTLVAQTDSSIGGKVAEKTGAKLKNLAVKKQVFCITHLPQIAGMAKTHYTVRKSVSGKRTRTEIAELNYDQRVEEIARMSGGEKITEATLKFAREMIKSD